MAHASERQRLKRMGDALADRVRSQMLNSCVQGWVQSMHAERARRCRLTAAGRKLQRWRLLRLLQAWRRCAMDATERCVRADALRTRAQQRCLHSSLLAWREEHHNTQQLAQRIADMHLRMKQVYTVSALHKWQLEARNRRRRRSAQEKVAACMARRHKARVFVGWRDCAEVAAQRSKAAASCNQARLQRLLRSCMSSWRKLTASDLRLTSNLQKLMARWSSKRVRAAYKAWHALVMVLQQGRTASDARYIHRQAVVLRAAFAAWIDAVREFRYHEAQADGYGS